MEYYTINQAARIVGMSDTYIRDSARSGAIELVLIEKEKLYKKIGVRAKVKAISRAELDRIVLQPWFIKSKKRFAETRCCL